MPTLRPELSRSRVHRLDRSRSQGWARRSKRSRIREFAGFPGFRTSPGIRCSRQMSRGYSASQPVPSAQLFGHLAGEQQERRVGRALASARLPPPLVLGQVEQRFHSGVAGPADRPPGDLVREGDGRPVRPALDRVLHLKLELGREAAEVDPGPAAQHAVLGELAGIGGTQLPPPGVVSLAELMGLVLGPERAERQQALRPRLRRGQFGPCRPCGRVRASCMLPGRAVPHAQTLAAAAVTAAGHRAGRQRPAAVQRRARGRRGMPSYPDVRGPSTVSRARCKGRSPSGAASQPPAG